MQVPGQALGISKVSAKHFRQRFGELAADRNRILDRGQGLLAAAEARQAVGEVVERGGEVGPEGVGSGSGERAIQDQRLLDRDQGLLASAEVRQAVREVGEVYLDVIAGVARPRRWIRLEAGMQ